MRSLLRRSIVVGALLSVLLSLTGCAGTSSPASGSDSADSPLSEYLNALYGGDLSPEEQEQKSAADDKAREEFVSQCMTEEGFEYIPVPSSYSFDAGGGEWKPEDREWVSQYGYGIINYPGKNNPAPVDDDVDPNQEYVATLSESEQNAYYEALYGPQPDENEMPEEGAYEYDWETAGCFGAAQHELEGEDPTQSDEHKPVMDAMNALYTDMEKAPELADLNAAWSSCMSDAGYPGFTMQYDAQNVLNDKYNQLWETQTGEGEPDESVTDELAKEEIKTALADLNCRENTKYRATYSEVQNRLEQQFIDDHKAELDALKADAEQGN